MHAFTMQSFQTERSHGMRRDCEHAIECQLLIDEEEEVTPVPTCREVYVDDDTMWCRVCTRAHTHHANEPMTRYASLLPHSANALNAPPTRAHTPPTASVQLRQA
jgi:hypothetical protein